MPVRFGPQAQALLRAMSAEEVDAAVSRAERRRPDLAMAVQAMADALTAGEGTEMIHQAALQQFLWWHLPRKYPEEDWTGLAEAAAELLDELDMKRLAEIARSEQTAAVLAAWATGPDEGAKAFRAAHGSSGVEPPDTAGWRGVRSWAARRHAPSMPSSGRSERRSPPESWHREHPDGAPLRWPSPNGC